MDENSIQATIKELRNVAHLAREYAGLIELEAARLDLAVLVEDRERFARCIEEKMAELKEPGNTVFAKLAILEYANYMTLATALKEP